MALKNFKQGSNIYFELLIACPVCHERGSNTPRSFWQHHGCGGQLYVGDNAYYLCHKCKMDLHVAKWSYGCPNHANENGEIVFDNVPISTMAAIIAQAGQLVTDAGIPWLHKFLENLEA